jgi:hypothetical protein
MLSVVAASKARIEWPAEVWVIVMVPAFPNVVPDPK